MLQLKSNEIGSEGNHIKVIKRTPQPDFPEHNHDFSELVLVRNGVGSHIINGHMFHLLPCTISCISDKDYHQYYGNEGVNLTNIIYKKEFLSVTSPVVDIVKRLENNLNELMIVESKFNQLQSISEQIKLELKANDVHSNYMATLLFEKILIILDRAHHAHSQHGEVMTPIVYICNHFRDASLTISEVCDTFCISQKRLNRTILDISGLNAAKFVNSLRIREAKVLLSRGKSITDVAMSVGFGDSNYFSTKFKSTVGYTPREFVKLVINK